MGVLRKVSQSLPYLVEPYVLLYVTALLLNLPLLSQYVYAYISEREGFPYNYHDQTACKQRHVNTTVIAALQRAQQKASSFNIGFMLCNYIPSTLVCLFMGSWSDKVGRKPILILSVFGAFAEASIVLATMYFKLPLWVLLIAGLVNGFGGYFTGLLIGSVTYIADITVKEKRAVRLGLLEGFVFFSGIFSSFPSGHLLDSLGFIKSYLISWSCLAGSLFYIVFILQESLPKEERRRIAEKNDKKGCCIYLSNAYHVLKQRGPNRWKVKLALPAVVVNSMMLQGITQMFTLYLLNKPLCFDSKGVGYFQGTRFLISGVGAAIGLRLLLRCVSEHKVIFLGFFSHIASMCLIAVSSTEWMVYLSCFLGLFAGVSSPILRGIISKNSAEGEQGAIFSFCSSMEMLFTFIGGTLFTMSYKVSLRTLQFPGMPFVVNSTLAIIPIGLAVIYAIKLNPREQLYESVPDGVEDLCSDHEHHNNSSSFQA